MAPKPETLIVAEIRKAIHKKYGKRAFCYRTHGCTMGRRGVPDLHYTIDGLSIWFEVKTKTGKLSPKQSEILREIAEAGGLAAVVTTPSQALQRIRDWLKERKKK